MLAPTLALGIASAQGDFLDIVPPDNVHLNNMHPTIRTLSPDLLSGLDSKQMAKSLTGFFPESLVGLARRARTQSKSGVRYRVSLADKLLRKADFAASGGNL